MCDNYVTCDECFEHRKEFIEKNNHQDIVLTKLETEVNIAKKLMFSILATLISGFAGTIFAVLSLG